VSCQKAERRLRNYTNCPPCSLHSQLLIFTLFSSLLYHGSQLHWVCFMFHFIDWARADAATENLSLSFLTLMCDTEAHWRALILEPLRSNYPMVLNSLFSTNVVLISIVYSMGTESRRCVLFLLLREARHVEDNERDVYSLTDHRMNSYLQCKNHINILSSELLK